MRATTLRGGTQVSDDRDSELVPKGDPRSSVISIDPERMWGTPCFAGTRIPIRSLFDHLKSGVSLDEFLDQFEGVSRDACARVLDMACERLVDDSPQSKQIS